MQKAGRRIAGLIRHRGSGAILVFLALSNVAQLIPVVAVRATLAAPSIFVLPGWSLCLAIDSDLDLSERFPVVAAATVVLSVAIWPLLLLVTAAISVRVTHGSVIVAGDAFVLLCLGIARVRLLVNAPAPQLSDQAGEDPLPETSRVRILLITPRFAPYIGGVETHVARLATSLANRGHTVEIFTQRTHRATPAREEFSGITLRRFNGWGGRSAYPFPPVLWRTVLKERARFDVIHSHGYHALAGLVAPLARRASQAVIFTPHYHATGHTALARWLHGLYRPIGQQVFDRADRVICVSTMEAELVRRDFGPSLGAKVVVIPNGVDRDEIQNAQPYAVDHAIVFAAGRLSDYKNVDRLVAAARYLPESFAVRIAGDGPDRTRLERLVRHHGVGSRVSFLGRLSDADLRRWYRTAAVCVTLSSHEAFGIVLLEGLAAGAPAVASGIPAHREVAAFGDPERVLFVSPAVPADELAATITRAARLGRTKLLLDGIPTWSWVGTETSRVYAEALAANDVSAVASSHTGR